MSGVDTWRDAAAIGRFGLLHLGALAVFWVLFSWSLVGWLAASYVVRMFGVTAGYHRYFSHRSFNHHYCMSSSRQGVHWWQFDATYLGLRVLAALGVARDLWPFVVRETRAV